MQRKLTILLFLNIDNKCRCAWKQTLGEGLMEQDGSHLAAKVVSSVMTVMFL